MLPYILLSREDNQSRQHSLRTLLNGVRSIVKTGNEWGLMPHDLPPWHAVYQQMRRWMAAGYFELLVEDVQSLLREFAGRKGRPTAVCQDTFAFIDLEDAHSERELESAYGADRGILEGDGGHVHFCGQPV